MKKIAVIGLGYVGLPLAVEFAKKYKVVGYDINQPRVKSLQKGHDSTLEVQDKDLKTVLIQSSDEINGKGLLVTYQESDIQDAQIYIITVPTPTDKHNSPVLTPILNASAMVGKYLAAGDIVIYESTVYPGVTEDECVPVLEKYSNLKYNQDFFVGYSPERINPGDKKHTVTKILKVTSGSTSAIVEEIDQLYQSIITAGTYKATSIKVAEAAKVIENAQRDINIAFVNELAKIFNRLEIDTNEVLEAAGTKWNFLPFKPGLVGGHCIGVDPYYLAQKAQEVGYHPEIILAGRRLNDGMGQYVASEVIKLMNKKGHLVGDAPILILGMTFKENCPDIRNTKVIDIYNELIDYGCKVEITDPWVEEDEVKQEFGIDLTKRKDLKKYQAIILAVAHEEFKAINLEDLKLDDNAVVYDVKGFYDRTQIDGRL